VSAAFTPGPWLVHATNRLVCQADGAFKKVKVKNGKVLADDLPNSICLLRDPGEDFNEDETLANGFLISAAPELYEALNDALAVHGGSYSWGDKAKAAMAKARGETL
jgi:hypothetical protein